MPEPITVQVQLRVNGELTEPFSTISLTENETFAWETAALLREIADTIEAQKPVTLFSLG